MNKAQYTTSTTIPLRFLTLINIMGCQLLHFDATFVYSIIIQDAFNASLTKAHWTGGRTFWEGHLTLLHSFLYSYSILC